MGYIGVRFDDKTDSLIRKNAANLNMNLSDYVRYKLDPTKSSSTNQIIRSFINEMQRQKVEIVEMRKELRLSIGAIIEILKPYGVTTEEMKKAGIDFFKKPSGNK